MHQYSTLASAQHTRTQHHEPQAGPHPLHRPDVPGRDCPRRPPRGGHR